MAGDGKVKPGTEYTNEDAHHDMVEVAKVLKSLVKQLPAINKRLEQLEQTKPQEQPSNHDEDDESFGEGDKRKALSALSQYVFNPEDKIMLHQMTNTPKRIAMALVIEHTVNEFINEHAFNPDSTVLVSDIFMKWFARVMRSIDGNLITQAMGFSQIEVEKQIEEGDRLEAKGEF